VAERPEVLIEKWLPVDVIGAESMRERGASSALPPLYFLHVWWARRPLITSRAAILASVLPAWRADWLASLRAKFPNEDSYKAWFLKLCGIFGDPLAGRKLVVWAKAQNVTLKAPPYTHKRAFTVSPAPEYLETLRDLLEHAWGTRTLSVLDPFAGGGSIPFEALRYGFTTYANELNPVASVILKATLEYPAKFGPKLADDIRKYGKILAEKVRERLEPFFPVQDGESIHAYIWARTITCPYTGKPIPLSPNWWLQKGATSVAVRPIFDANAHEARFEIVKGKSACERAKPDQGTVRRGDAISPWAHNQPVDGDYIKAEAQAGRMGQQLYALAVKKRGGVEFRAPTDADKAAVEAAKAELGRKLPEWEAKGWVPNEIIPYGHRSHERDGIVRYGVLTMRDFFSPRQLLSLCSFVETLHSVKAQVLSELDGARGIAVVTYLGLMGDKSADYNSRFMRWDGTRNKLANTFDRHDFSFKWSHGEFDCARNMYPWVLDQISDAYEGLAALASGEKTIFRDAASRLPVKIRKGNATSLAEIPTEGVYHICVDPPYYNNVSYSELSDFFYVWMKRTIADVHPDTFTDDLTNRDDEVVANPARFHGVENSPKKRMALATVDYERKMAAAFREMHRVLRDDGVLTVMFTHKKVEAWDTLATSLIGAGFAIRSSWPVHTESEHSLHQAKTNSAQSTILLTCRKRTPAGEPVWWDDIKAKVRRVAREKAEEFERQGIRNVDLYIATFGPTLAILSEHWPVLTAEVDERTGEPKPLRPEVALDLAREEVVALRKQGLLLGRTVQFDLYTDWYLMAWDAFRAEQFPGDEARKLAIAVGLNLEGQVISEKRLVTKKGSNVDLQLPKARRKKDMVDPDKKSFDCWIDAVHTAMLLYEEDGAQACKAFLQRTNLRTDATFKACVQALLNAIPRTKEKGKFVRSEADTLEAMRLAFFDDLVPPVEEEPKIEPEQLQLLSGGNGEALGDDDDEEEGEEDEA
jgi:putative DNA methylase